ncbi:hypothetical protein [Photobacterium sp. OFAV2-7]|uniref:hypothetical protein n=1 Tax=Photobacterium sp. OFAV2-7 TaxID=2917748 RepID=UPI001EF5E08F|nr:hypothetical protein [Photobacterium sp. OFAV2-7]MCG7585933.1 hypothetical protein [Photobacterium sp. OFAV2-7]
MIQMIAKKLRLVLVSTLLLVPSFVQASEIEAIINLYNQAAEGDEAKVEMVYQQLESLIEAEGPKPLTMVYLGGTETLKGRDAWMPWNKMKYVEQGLAKIDKGLDILDAYPLSLAEQRVISGIHEYYLAQAISASTFTLLPDMFNYFERGYDIYLSLLEQPEFAKEPFAATAWIYGFAVQAAIRAEDMPQARNWLAQMQQQDANHPQTLKAIDLVNQG